MSINSVNDTIIPVEVSTEFFKELTKLFDTCVVVSEDPQKRLVHDIDGWCSGIEALKEKYNLKVFNKLYDFYIRKHVIHVIEASHEVADIRQEKIKDIIKEFNPTINDDSLITTTGDMLTIQRLMSNYTIEEIYKAIDELELKEKHIKYTFVKFMIHCNGEVKLNYDVEYNYMFNKRLMEMAKEYEFRPPVQATRDRLDPEIMDGGLFFEPSTEQQNSMRARLLQGMGCGQADIIKTTSGPAELFYEVRLPFKNKSPDHDLNSNGKRSKVVTGPAGNRYPIPKRKWR